MVLATISGFQSAERERESESDAIDFHTHVYTHEKFKKVQAQFRGKVTNSTFKKFVVTYDGISGEVKCRCLLFESRGILCRRSLSVLSFERVNKVAPRYILERWKSEELTVILHRVYNNVMAEMQEYKAKSKEKYSLSREDTSLENINELPPRITNSSKKKEKKAPNKLNLLDGGSVVQSNSNHYH
ncbi:hypothetical protein Ahy_A06g025956 [Arachis hypogaea]|uniref:Uncharacterized protein n=1 Tax=Arachis hypogaea TaxID=3818 RepID=A0A445CJ15_ARAHY|nr:hypothetical protein Ahy_A06g025956 [Arachis hypogaea]